MLSNDSCSTLCFRLGVDSSLVLGSSPSLVSVSPAVFSSSPATFSVAVVACEVFVPDSSFGSAFDLISTCSGVLGFLNPRLACVRRYLRVLGSSKPVCVSLLRVVRVEVDGARVESDDGVGAWAAGACNNEVGTGADGAADGGVVASARLWIPSHALKNLVTCADIDRCVCIGGVTSGLPPVDDHASSTDRAPISESKWCDS